MAGLSNADFAQVSPQCFIARCVIPGVKQTFSCICYASVLVCVDALVLRSLSNCECAAGLKASQAFNVATSQLLNVDAAVDCL